MKYSSRSRHLWLGLMMVLCALFGIWLLGRRHVDPTVFIMLLVIQAVLALVSEGKRPVTERRAWPWWGRSLIFLIAAGGTLAVQVGTETVGATGVGLLLLLAGLCVKLVAQTKGGGSDPTHGQE